MPRVESLVFNCFVIAANYLMFDAWLQWLMLFVLCFCAYTFVLPDACLMLGA